jgi:hypothetical protein
MGVWGWPAPPPRAGGGRAATPSGQANLSLTTCLVLEKPKENKKRF